MAVNKLSVREFEAAKPKAKRYQLSDGGGLALWVYPNGKKVWLYRYRRPSDRKGDYLTIGAVGIKHARSARDECEAILREGFDPKQVKAAKKAGNASALTMQALFELWHAHLVFCNELTEKTIQQHAQRWRLHLYRALGAILAQDVTRAHLAQTLDAMRKSGIKEETRKALTTLNQMLDYGVTRHFVESNPARMLRPKDFSASSSKPKDRYLNIEELRMLWLALEESSSAEDNGASVKMSPVLVNAIKLLILTGARRVEVAGMKWQELNLRASKWLLPAARAKNGKAHTIYLSELAKEILETQRTLNLNQEYVFESQQKPELPINKDSLTKVIERLRGCYLSDKRRNEGLSGVLEHLAPFSVHDIRRSAATAWGDYLKTEPHVIERMLNHQPMNKLVAVYQRAAYVEEQKAAWLAWGEIVAHRIAKDPDNVTPIAAARKAAL
ncbi:MAG: site-specific integrase [Hahellaceae bacterium]|nr:site-specific integrase [Hahellaceae bacterium]